MHALMGTVDLVVLPSHREGVPRGLIEAAAMELPIITTDTPGCREVVDDEVNGILVPVQDVDSIVQAIERLVVEPGLRKAFGERSRQRVVSQFELSIVADQIRQVYDKLLG